MLTTNSSALRLQEGAEYLARQLLRRRFACTATSLGELPTVEALAALCGEGAPPVLFLLSTTGDGEFPPSALPLWRSLLRASLDPSTLAGLRFTIFGFGDSAYEKFNAAARKLCARVMQLGGAALCERGLGDDSAAHGRGAEGDLDAWLANTLVPALDRISPMPAGLEVQTAPLPLIPRYIVSLLEGEQARAVLLEEASRLPGPVPHPSRVPHGAHLYAGTGGDDQPLVAVVERTACLTAPGAVREVMHLSLRLPAGAVRRVVEGGEGRAQGEAPWAAAWAWRAGDVAVLSPRNEAYEVEAFAARAGWALDTVVAVREVVTEGGSAGAHALPPALSIRSLLSWYLDIGGQPTRGALEQLSLLATDEEQAEKLVEMAGPGGGEGYAAYVARERRTLREVLVDFDSIASPLALPLLLDLIPPLQPRHFSIASAAAGPEGTLDLCVALVNYSTPRGRVKRGVASSWLSGLAVGDPLPLWVRRGGFTIATTPSCATPPLILVGPGTGVAPMRAAVQEAAAMGAREETRHLAPPSVHLYFGCRNRERDWLYGSEMRAAAGDDGGGESSHPVVYVSPSASPSSATLTRYGVAFSRDSNTGAGGRAYVQSLLRLPARSAELGTLLQQGGARVFIAGSAGAMPSAVASALRDAAAVVGGEGVHEVRKWSAGLERAGRLCVEAWS